MAPSGQPSRAMMKPHGRRIAVWKSCTCFPAASRPQYSHRGRRPMKLSIAVAVAAVLAGCASTPPEEDPVQIKLNDLEARTGRIERVVSNQSLVQLAQNV